MTARPLPGAARALLAALPALLVAFVGFALLRLPQSAYAGVRSALAFGPVLEWLLAFVAAAVVAVVVLAIAAAAALFAHRFLFATAQSLVATAVMAAIFLALATAILGTTDWERDGAAGGAGDLDALVTALFETHVIALEVLGVLLTAAMVGALVIARPLGAPPDASHYPATTPAEVEAAARVSDVASAHLPPPNPPAPGGPEGSP